MRLKASLAWLLLGALYACHAQDSNTAWAVRGDTQATQVRWRIFNDSDPQHWYLRDATGKVYAGLAASGGLLDFQKLYSGGRYQLYHQQQAIGAVFSTPEAQATPVLFAGSCLQRGLWGLSGRILQTLTAQATHTTTARLLWLGDTLYLNDNDLHDAVNLQQAWDRQFAEPALRTLLGTVASYAIWDDHDFGPNDASRDFALASRSREIFQQHWANPEAALPASGLLSYRFRQGPVEVFMLDDRSARAPLNGRQRGRQQFGATQMAWLQAALLASDAPFRLVVSGGQFWTDDAWEEGWQHYPDERNTFVSWLEAHPLPGLFFVSGDRHHSTLFSRQFASGLRVHELTCSALTSSPEEAAAPGYAAVERQFTVVRNNFCRLDFDPKSGRIQVRVFAEDGAELANRRVQVR